MVDGRSTCSGFPNWSESSCSFARRVFCIVNFTYSTLRATSGSVSRFRCKPQKPHASGRATSGFRVLGFRGYGSACSEGFRV